jgi:hypothetical protein
VGDSLGKRQLLSARRRWLLGQHRARRDGDDRQYGKRKFLCHITSN